MMKRYSSFSIALVLGAALMAVPSLANAQTVVVPVETAPPQHDDTYTTVNMTPVLSGALTFGVSYGIAVMIAATTDSDANDRLYVPIVGPWLAISDREDCPIESSSCDSETTKKILLGVDGVFQAVGAVTVVYGLLTPRRLTRTQVAGQDVEFVPVAMQGGGRGFGLTGAF
jgi:hypothetical protein